jgi:hypothetical protein
MALAAPPSYTIEAVESAPPRALSADMRKLLSDKCVRLKNSDGTVLEVWLRKTVPTKATEEQLRNGLTYREVPQSMVLGAVRFENEYTDYRKQKIAAGTYTLRLAVQPVSDDHVGTAPYRDFVLLCPAADDKKPELLKEKALRELSEKSAEDHPGVMLLFPPGKDAAEKPKLLDKGKGHWVLYVKVPATAAGKMGAMGLGLTVVGVSASR